MSYVDAPVVAVHLRVFTLVKVRYGVSLITTLSVARPTQLCSVEQRTSIATTLDCAGFAVACGSSVQSRKISAGSVMPSWLPSIEKRYCRTPLRHPAVVVGLARS